MGPIGNNNSSCLLALHDFLIKHSSHLLVKVGDVKGSGLGQNHTSHELDFDLFPNQSS